MFAPYLDGLRSYADQRFAECSRAKIRRRAVDADGNPAYTTVDGYEVLAWDVIDPDCPGRLAGSRGAGGSRTVTVGDAEIQLAVREWHMPASKPALQDGDLIEVTAGENAGAVLRVVESSWQDQATARRVPVVETQRPEEWA